MNRRRLLQSLGLLSLLPLLGFKSAFPHGFSASRFLTTAFNDFTKRKGWKGPITIVVSREMFEKFQDETPVIQRFVDSAEKTQPTLKFKTATMYANDKLALYDYAIGYKG